MSGINKVILVGNLGNDPDSKFLPSGSMVTNISVATSESWKDKNTGEKQERTEWHRVVFFNRLAEIAGQYLKKGSKVYIEGQLRTQKYEKDGIDRYVTDIIAKEMQMLDSRSEGQQQPYSPPQQQPAQQQPQSSVDMDDDIPFWLDYQFHATAAPCVAKVMLFVY